ncbi:hypothetical protein ES708_27305 [subsurface metagenome]
MAKDKKKKKKKGSGGDDYGTFSQFMGKGTGLSSGVYIGEPVDRSSDERDRKRCH